MKIHMVKKGDTLYELSKKYGISLEKIIEANPQLADPNQLNIGDKVKIPSSQSVSVPMSDNIIHKHVVKQGDSLWQLSKAWGVTLRDMIDANPQLKNPNALLVGEVVNIPKAGQKEEVNAGGAAENAIHNKVTPGGKTHTGPKVESQPTETAPPVIPQLPQLPQLSENTKVPNNAPIQNIPQQPVPMSLPKLPNVSVSVPSMHKEKVEKSQHLFMEYSVPAQEVMENVPLGMEKSNSCPMSDQMLYPGITEGYSPTSPQYEQSYGEQQGYGNQPNWGQPQYMQSDCCSPNWSPYTGDTANYSNMGYGQGVSPQFNNVAPMENIQVTLSDVYSCISPYEWTFPQHMMPAQGMMNSAPQVMPFGENAFPNSQPVMQPQQDCGCHSRESSVGVINQEGLQAGIEATGEEAVSANVAGNSIVGSDELLDRNQTKKVQTSSSNKGRSATGDSKKGSKLKSRQQKRRNPWIKN